jgi:Zn-dependent M28 family amino/carboxypeptidase
MYSNFLEDVVYFNNLDKKQRRVFIKDCLLKLGIIPTMQTFDSCFGKGKNIYAEIGNKNKKIVLSAHYDGKSFFDNNAAVITLLQLSNRILNQELPFSIIVLFTDQEETYQQGSAYFIRNYTKDGIVKNINIDGFGIGNEIFTVESLIKNINTDNDLFLTDKDEFSKYRIPSISYFSAFKEDFDFAKKSGEIYQSFEKYNSETFYRNSFNVKNIQEIIESLWKIIK